MIEIIIGIIAMFIVIILLILAFVYQAEQMKHFGELAEYYTGPCILEKNNKCGESGTQVRILQCIDNPNNSFGCLYKGKQIKGFIEETRKCTAGCVLCEWEI
jgi:hypothetical protein